MKFTIDKRFKAASQFVSNMLVRLFKKDFYDNEKEQFQIATLTKYVKHIREFKQMAQDDEQVVEMLTKMQV